MIKKIIIALYCGLIGLLFIPLLIIFGINAEWFGELPKTEKLENPSAAIATEVYSSDGKLLGKYFNENRSPISYYELSENLVNALISTEDARFYEHSGIDFKGLARAIIKPLTLQGSAGGASTITQQLAKNLFGRPQFSTVTDKIIQKLKEWVIAVKLESFYTKEEIIAMYFNTVDFGHNSYGIKSACRTYFNKSTDEVSIPEAALLVGMLQAPTRYSPIRNPDMALQRRNVVLGQMLKYERITQSDFEKLKKEKIVTENFKAESHNEGTAMYFREYIRLFVEHLIRKNGLDLYSDGLKIYTTIDSRMQKYAEEAAFSHLEEMQALLDKQFKKKLPWADNPEIIDITIKRSERYRALKKAGVSESKIIQIFNKPLKMKVFSYSGAKDKIMSPLDSIKYYKYFLQTGAMAMEPLTGQVKVWVGGTDFRFFKYDHVNIQAKRQVGSTFKPFVYASAIKEKYSPCLEVANVPVVFDNFDNWQPKNSDGKYGGTQSLKQGLAYSTNCITAWIVKQIGIEPVIRLAKNMGIVSELPPYPSLCLGVADISVYEMVSAFNTFAGLGTYVEPIVINSIKDKTGNEIYKAIPKTKDALDEGNAYVMIEMLKGVTGRGGTAHRLRFRYNLDAPVAGKTGTTQNQSDGWFIGMTPNLTMGVWVGNEDRAIHFNDMYNGQGATLALPIFARTMQKIYEDKTLNFPKSDWKKPSTELPVEIDCNVYEERKESSEGYFDAGGIK